MNLPTWETYCDNTTAVNALMFELGNGVSVWFSYKTPIAFQINYGVPVVRQNEWGPTTGKHLNAIDGGSPIAKKERLDTLEFAKGLEKALTESEATP